jgi:hypothetical protein
MTTGLVPGQVHTNYIYFQKCQKFPQKKFKNLGNKESDEIFENISFVKMESSKLIN